MPPVPAPADPGRGVSRPGARPEPDGWEPVITRPDPVPLEEWLAWDPDEEDEPPGFDEDDLDPEGSGLPWDEDLAAIVAETGQVMAERAADAAYLVCWVAGTGLAAGALAVPAGIALHRYVLPVMFAALGTGLPASFLDVYGVWEITGLALAGLLIAVAGALLPAGWAARTPAASALRAE